MIVLTTQGSWDALVEFYWSERSDVLETSAYRFDCRRLENTWDQRNALCITRAISAITRYLVHVPIIAVELFLAASLYSDRRSGKSCGVSNRQLSG